MNAIVFEVVRTQPVTITGWKIPKQIRRAIDSVELIKENKIYKLILNYMKKQKIIVTKLTTINL